MLPRSPPCFDEAQETTRFGERERDQHDAVAAAQLNPHGLEKPAEPAAEIFRAFQKSATIGIARSLAHDGDHHM